MKFQYDPKRPGYRNPKDSMEKMFVLIALLREKRRRPIDQIAELLEKSERQVRRDLNTLERFFDLDFDDRNRPFICTYD